MEIKTMAIEDIEERMSAITAELENEDADLEALNKEVDELNERKAELKKEAEERKAEAEKAAEEGTVVKEFKEKEIMEERTFTPDSVEYRDAYLKNLMGKALDIEERTALTDAADIIPTETVNMIYGKLEENPLIAELDALRIPGYVQVPYAKTVNNANWVAMDTAATDSADVVDSISLTAKKLIKTIEITADIQAMSVPAFQAWLTSKLAQKMEAAICAAVIKGAGTSTVPEGITEGVTPQSDLTEVSVASLAGLMANVGAAYQADAIWIMTPATFFTYVVPLAADSNGVLVMNGIEKMLLGHKVILDANADANIIFGSLNKGYVFNYGEGISIEADQSVAFRAGSTVYRAMALCDGAVVDADAFAFAELDIASA